MAEPRGRLADLDREQLPSLDQAKEPQAARAAEIEQRRAAAGRRNEIGPLQSRSGDAAAGETRAGLKPLGKTAGEIRLAWQLAKTVDQLAQAIEDRGLILVHVSREEAADSYQARICQGPRPAKPHPQGRFRRSRSARTRIDQRTTGDQWEEIQKKFGGIDPANC